MVFKHVPKGNGMAAKILSFPRRSGVDFLQTCHISDRESEIILTFNYLKKSLALTIVITRTKVFEPCVWYGDFPGIFMAATSYPGTSI